MAKKGLSIWCVMVLASLALIFTNVTILCAQDTISLAGSSTIRPVVSAASIPFGKANNVTFKIEGGGSSHGVKSVGTGAADIGDASRYLKDKEKAAYPNLVPHLIGTDGVAIILNKSVGVTSLTKKQIQDMYLGKVTNWKEVGGPDMPIYLVSKEHGRSTLELFLKYAGLEGEEQGKHMKHRIKKSNDAWSTVEARIIGANQQALAQVAGKKGAIGYVSVGDAVVFAKKTGKIILPDMDGVAASIENVKNGTFPIVRPLHCVTNGQPSGNVKKFIDYLLSPGGQKIVVAKGFVRID